MRNQDERRSNLESFKEGDVRFLVCTDVAARGIDIAGLPFVIQTTLPDDIENYIHRIGRCGRAERMGLAISIVATEREKVWYHKCPSRGKNCTPPPGNTRLTIPFGNDGKLKSQDPSKWVVDEGGCTIWYDEPDLIKLVEKRIGQPMAVMDPEDFSVPGVFETPLGEEFKKKQKAKTAEVKEPPSRRALKRKKEEAQLIVYGAKKNDATMAASAKHTSALAPVVKELADLEREIQQMFAMAMWGNCDSSTPSVGGKGRAKGGGGASAPPAAAAPRAAPAPTPAQEPQVSSEACPAEQPAEPEQKRPSTGWAAGAAQKPKRKARW